MGKNKIEYYGKVLLDLTGDTVTASQMMENITAHDKTGAQVRGSFTLAQELGDQGSLLNQIEAALRNKVSGGGAVVTGTVQFTEEDGRDRSETKPIIIQHKLGVVPNFFMMWPIGGVTPDKFPAGATYVFNTTSIISLGGNLNVLSYTYNVDYGGADAYNLAAPGTLADPKAHGGYLILDAWGADANQVKVSTSSAYMLGFMQTDTPYRWVAGVV